MSAKRAALVSFLLLTSFVTLTIFFASFHEMNHKHESQAVTMDGYGVSSESATSPKARADRPYKTAFSF